MVRHGRGFIAILLAVTVFSISAVPTYAIGGKVSLSPDSTTLVEGGASQDFTIRLNAPIIIAPLDPRSYVNLNVTSSDPSRISITPNPVVYLPSEWAQTRTLTVSALNNSNFGDGETINLTVTADSGSAYYDNYTVTLPITITDSTPAPAPVVTPAVTPQTTPSTPKAPSTGFEMVDKSPATLEFFASLTIAFLASSLLIKKGNNK